MFMNNICTQDGDKIVKLEMTYNPITQRINKVHSVPVIRTLVNNGCLDNEDNKDSVETIGIDQIHLQRTYLHAVPDNEDLGKSSLSRQNAFFVTITRTRPSP